MLQCVAVCCSVLHRFVYRELSFVCCSVLECVAVCCSVLQCVAVRYIDVCTGSCLSKTLCLYLNGARDERVVHVKLGVSWGRLHGCMCCQSGACVCVVRVYVLSGCMYVLSVCKCCLGVRLGIS